MLEILVLAIAMLVMARKGKPRRRSMAGYTRGNINEVMALGTLAPNDVVTTALGAVDGRTWISSIRATWSLRGWTVIDNVGPILVGLCHGDYSDAEVEAWIEQTEATSWTSGSLADKEISDRRIRKIGTFGQVGQSLGNQVLNNGRPITTKLGWKLVSGQSVRIWAYNTGSGAVATTDPDVVVDGHANLWDR